MTQYQPSVWSYCKEDISISAPLLYGCRIYFESRPNPIKVERLLQERIKNLREVILDNLIFKDDLSDRSLYFNTKGFCVQIKNPCRRSVKTEGWYLHTNLLFSEKSFEIAGKFTFYEIKKFACKLLINTLSDIESSLELRE